MGGSFFMPRTRPLKGPGTAFRDASSELYFRAGGVTPPPFYRLVPRFSVEGRFAGANPKALSYLLLLLVFGLCSLSLRKDVLHLLVGGVKS